MYEKSKFYFKSLNFKIKSKIKKIHFKRKRQNVAFKIVPEKKKQLETKK